MSFFAVPQKLDIAFAKQFAKATGDLGFLSTNDVDLIALTVRLHREAGLMLKDRPAALSVGEGQVNFDWAPQSTKEARQEARSEASETGSSSGWAVVGRKSRGLAYAPPLSEAEEKPKAADEEKPERTEDNVDTVDRPAESGDLTQVPEADDVPEEDEESEDGSSAGEWVTEENKHRFGIGIHPDADVHITCATADYSVQNVSRCAAASKTLVDLSDVLKCDGGCTTEDWQHFAASGVFQGQWKSWLRPLADADGNCWEALCGAGMACKFENLNSQQGHVAKRCEQDELQSLTASESLGLVPRFLRHFTLRLGASPKKSSALWELLKHAEARVVGAYRERLSPFRTQRCDVCCTDASCPFSTETGLCPADSQFDANQDLRDRLWPRAELILDGLEQAHQKAEVEDSFVAPVVMPFQFCERMSRRNSTLVTDVARWTTLRAYLSRSLTRSIAFGSSGRALMSSVQHKQFSRLAVPVGGRGVAGLPTEEKLYAYQV
eukprot:s197_g11.t1